MFNAMQKNLTIKFLSLSDADKNLIKKSLSEDNLKVLEGLIDDFSTLGINSTLLAGLKDDIRFSEVNEVKNKGANIYFQLAESISRAAKNEDVVAPEKLISYLLDYSKT